MSIRYHNGPGDRLHVIMPEGCASTFSEVAEYADRYARKSTTGESEDAFRLSQALALLVQKLAEAHRAELDGLLGRVRRLEERLADAAPELSVDDANLEGGRW